MPYGEGVGDCTTFSINWQNTTHSTICDLSSQRVENTRNFLILLRFFFPLIHSSCALVFRTAHESQPRRLTVLRSYGSGFVPDGAVLYSYPTPFMGTETSNPHLKPVHAFIVLPPTVNLASNKKPPSQTRFQASTRHSYGMGPAPISLVFPVLGNLFRPLARLDGTG